MNVGESTVHQLSRNGSFMWQVEINDENAREIAQQYRSTPQIDLSSVCRATISAST